MRLFVAILIGKIILFLTTTLKLGGGSAAPGLIALKIEPNLVSKLASQIPQNVVITGTNGKTTTARMLNHLVKPENIKTLRNSTGSNLERGVTSSLISKVSMFGKISNIDLGIWELDEAAFNKVVFKIKPQIMVFLNAFRDQLDRYGEVDTVVKKWWDTLAKVDWKPVILTNSGDTNTWVLSKATDVNPDLTTFEFRVKNHQINHERSIKMNTARHRDEFQAEILKNKGLSGSEIKVKYPGGNLKLNFHIPGIYHIYDLLAAFATYYLLNLPIQNIQERIKTFSPAFGRVEKISLGDKEGYVFLIKNPAGATAVFETIAPEIEKDDQLLIALNDNFADGTDVSWIWDANFEQLPVTTQLSIIASGTRAQDLSLRLKYAGFEPKQITVENNLKQALSKAKKDLKGRLFILPTYTALLELQAQLTKSGVKSHYWKEL